MFNNSRKVSLAEIFLIIIHLSFCVNLTYQNKKKCMFFFWTACSKNKVPDFATNINKKKLINTRYLNFSLNKDIRINYLVIKLFY